MEKNDCIYFNKSNGCCLKHSKISHDGGLRQPCVESPCLDYVSRNRDIIEMAKAEVVSLENFFESLKDSKAYFTISGLYKRIAKGMDSTILCILEKYGCVGDPEKLIEVVKSGKIYYDNGYRDGRVAVRQILAEIDSEIQAALENNIARLHRNEDIRICDYVEGKIHALRDIAVLLDELKKRYIGEQEDKHTEGEQ